MLETLLKSPLVAFIAFTVFACIVEYIGWCNLPNLPQRVQDPMLGFLVLFAMIYMIFFFVTLWWKPAALIGNRPAQSAAVG